MVCLEICCADYSMFTSQRGAEEGRCLTERLTEKTFVLFVDLQFPASEVSQVGYDVCIYLCDFFFCCLKCFLLQLHLKCQH